MKQTEEDLAQAQAGLGDGTKEGDDAGAIKII